MKLNNTENVHLANHTPSLRMNAKAENMARVVECLTCLKLAIQMINPQRRR
ncbi:hypothetical protein VCJ_001141 [Vibrio metoecus]|nr:hypothetical protein VCJ_001141 [Vibrio metoecus]